MPLADASYSITPRATAQQCVVAVLAALALAALTGCGGSSSTVRRTDIDSDFAYTPTDKEKRQLLRSPGGGGGETAASSSAPGTSTTAATRPSSSASPKPGASTSPSATGTTKPPPLPASQLAIAEERVRALNAAAKTPSKTDKTAAADKSKQKDAAKTGDKAKDQPKDKEKDKATVKKGDGSVPPLPQTVAAKKSQTEAPTLGNTPALEPDSTPAKSKTPAKTTASEDRDEPSRPTSSAPSDERLPTARPVPGKRGFVFSPYVSGGGPVDIRGFASGIKVQCPYTRKVFLVP